MNTRQKQLDLVRKCLALAKSPVPGEAAAAQRKADELIAKWVITASELTSSPLQRPSYDRPSHYPGSSVPYGPRYEEHAPRGNTITFDLFTDFEIIIEGVWINGVRVDSEGNFVFEEE